MKDLAQKFLSDAERTRVTEAVKATEELTAGEIVVMIISASYHYPMANVIGAAVFSLPLALIFTTLTAEWLWIGGQNMWLFLGWQAGLFIFFHEVIKFLGVTDNFWMRNLHPLCFIYSFYQCLSPFLIWGIEKRFTVQIKNVK